MLEKKKKERKEIKIKIITVTTKKNNTVMNSKNKVNTKLHFYKTVLIRPSPRII